MKPILLTGTAAYSPFRLDAIRAALGSCAPELKASQIDARWVYAIQPEGDGPDEETLARAALLRGDLVNGFVRGKLGYKGTFIADAGAIGALSRALWTDADFQIGL